MAIGSDLDFYGSWGGGGGYGGGGYGLFQAWNTNQASPYLGASSYMPSLQDLLPATAADFLTQQAPELSGLSGLSRRLSPEVNQLYGDWRGTSAALTPAGQYEFFRGLQGREDIQGLLSKAGLTREGTYLQNYEGATSLTDLIGQELGKSGSALSGLYGGLGVGADVVEKDIRALLTGGQSGLGRVVETQLGSTGGLTPGMREAALARLFGESPIDIGGGQVFNPLSSDILSDEYQLNFGNVAGEGLAGLAGGLLSTQDLAITQQLAGAFARARSSGADLGYKGFGLGNALADISQGSVLAGGGTIGQGGDLAARIDQMFGRQKMSGTTGLYKYITSQFA